MAQINTVISVQIICLFFYRTKAKLEVLKEAIKLGCSNLRKENNQKALN